MYYLEALSMNELHLLVNDLENESIQFILERDLLNHEELEFASRRIQKLSHKIHCQMIYEQKYCQ